MKELHNISLKIGHRTMVASKINHFVRLEYAFLPAKFINIHHDIIDCHYPFQVKINIQHVYQSTSQVESPI